MSGEPYWIHGPPDQPEPVCRECGIYLDHDLCSQYEWELAWEAAGAPRRHPGGRCHSCLGETRCLACGDWLPPEDAQLEPIGCVLCGAASRHGVEVPSGDQ